MNYIGSKARLCDSFISKTIQEVCGNYLDKYVFCDLFAGTGIVGRTFKSKVKKVISNDIELYSYVLNRNYIKNHKVMDNMEDYIDELNNTHGINDGFVYNHYCYGSGSERQYFSDENGKKIDAIRSKIESLVNNKTINEDMYYFLLCSLLESADKVANTASVYGAFLKHLKNQPQNLWL